MVQIPKYKSSYYFETNNFSGWSGLFQVIKEEILENYEDKKECLKPAPTEIIGFTEEGNFHTIQRFKREYNHYGLK